MSGEEWLTTFQAADLSGYHSNYIRKLLREGKVQGRKWGLSWQVNRISLLTFLEKAESLGAKRGPKRVDDM